MNPANTSDSAGIAAGDLNDDESTGKNPRRLAEPPTHVFAGSLIGYARVSRSDQNLDRQHDALVEAGCSKVFSDEGVSGARTSRPGLDSLLLFVRPGDTICVQALDRLGRRTSALLALVEELRAQGIGLRILNLGLDTSSPSGQLVLTVMAALAEMERTILIERTKDGLEAARKRGKRGGRPPALTAERKVEANRMHDAGRSVAEIARVLLVSERTVRRVLQPSVV